MLVLWDDGGIKAWFFPRTSVPEDITKSKPQPSGWGKPVASLPTSTCQTSNYFHDHVLVLNTALW